MVVKFLLHWKSLAGTTASFTRSPKHWRALFNQSLDALGLQQFEFRPYSLRRGGATWWFSRHHSLDKILLQGRWQAPKTARIYLNEGLAVLAEMRLPPSLPALAPFLKFFHRYQRSPDFKTLEPPCPRQGRTGGRGKKPKKGTNKPKKGSRRGKRFFCWKSKLQVS